MTIRHLFVREYECFVLRLCIFYRFFYRDVGKGGQGGKGSGGGGGGQIKLTLSQQEEQVYAFHIITRPPRFSDLPSSHIDKGGYNNSARIKISNIITLHFDYILALCTKFTYCRF